MARRELGNLILRPSVPTVAPSLKPFHAVRRVDADHPEIDGVMSVVKTFGTISGEIERRIWRIC
jgi:hypothetical protein